MTGLEQRAIRALREVQMPEQGWHARRAELLYGFLVLDPGRKLDTGNASDLWYLVWRYRRQVADAEVVREANRIVNGAMNLAFP